jgi:hypothetical protein
LRRGFDSHHPLIFAFAKLKKSIIFLFIFGTPALYAAGPKIPESKTPSQVPFLADFRRGIEVEGGAMATNPNQTGAQYFRIQSRYLDPDVNAFVGLLTTFTHFNEKPVLAKPPDELVAHWLGSWGIDIGIVRGRHLWEIDLMGASLGDHLAFGPALVGEHELFKRLKLYHRTAGDFFLGDTLLDSDQGLIWYPWTSVGFSAGYRILSAQHTNRSGPRVGLLIRFESPKIPFFFPSLG